MGLFKLRTFKKLRYFKVREQIIPLREVFTRHTREMIMSRTCEELQINEKSTKLNRTVDKHMNRYFTEENTPKANEYMKRRSTALVTKEI